MTDAAAQPCAPWESELTSVVVHARGAVCRRLARGVVPADGRVRVRGLPRVLDPLSLRAYVVDGPALRVTGARIAVEAEPLAPEAAPELVRETERLTEERRSTEARRDRQLRRIEEVTALRPVPPPRRRDDPHRRTPVEAWLRLAEFVDERLAELHTGLVELDERLRRVEFELDVAADRLARASTDTPSTPVHTTVCADLSLTETDAGEGAGAGPVDIEIEYRVPGAVWVPSYRLTHRQDEKGGRLVLRASVAQRTGEDWTGVRLGLSTADLHRPTGAPVLRSVRIGRRQPAPAPSGWREPPTGLAGLFAGYDAAGPSPAVTARGLSLVGGAAETAQAPQYAGAAPVAPGAVRSRAAGRPKAPGALPPPAAAA
ncbi:DUF4139 domain-containing protein, partial [Streptomyces sp. NPDC059639]|uniref:DUF4139 domain-containing protein n=1 Tax=Streptomyces sp. NPDC059639 TaxID=3346891 RepID=UPI003678283C